MANNIVNKISVKDASGLPQTYDVSTSADKVTYGDGSNVKAKLDSLGTAAYKSVGTENGVAPLGADSKVPSAYLPTSQGKNNVVRGYRNPVDGLFYQESTYTTAITGEVDIIYIDLTTDTTWMQDENASPVFVQIGGSGSGGSGSIIEGYYKTANGKFYEESTFVTEITGAADTIYIDLLTDTTWRYDTTETEYVPIGGDSEKTEEAYTHSQMTSGNPHHVTKSDIGLSLVENYKSLKVSGQQELTQTEKEFAVNNLGLSMIHSLAKTLDVSEEDSVTFYDATISDDTIILGIYTNNGLLYSSIATDGEAHTITVTYDVTDVEDDFKVAIVYITDRTIITTDTINYLGIGKLLNVVTP